MNWTIALTAVLPALFAAVVGGSVVHFLTRRRDAESERRKQRLDYLMSAYRILAHAAHRNLEGERGERFESALDDILMLGSQEQIAEARQVINSLATDRQASIDGLLVTLRRDLRTELDLPDDGLKEVPSVRLGESFDKAAARTGAAAAGAVTQAGASMDVGARETPKSRRRLQELRALVARAPGAAVVGAYQEVSAALNELLEHNEASAGAQTDGVVLAQIAASSGFVSEQLLETIRGLAIMKDIGWGGGSGTGLSAEQANQYLDLATAALYVLDHGAAARPGQV